MLEIIVPAIEYWDEKNELFVPKTKEQTLRLEHSLVSLSKWESKWHRPFLSTKDKTNEEILRLSYTGDDSYDPVISVASKNYDITMDIINGKVDYIRNKPFGMLIVILRGEDAERKKALEYISKNVYKLERLGGR